jgi:hypothetical protein
MREYRAPGLGVTGWVVRAVTRIVERPHSDHRLHAQVGLAAANPGARLTQDVQARSASAAAARI